MAYQNCWNLPEFLDSCKYPVQWRPTNILLGYQYSALNNFQTFIRIVINYIRILLDVAVGPTPGTYTM